MYNVILFPYALQSLSCPFCPLYLCSSLCPSVPHCSTLLPALAPSLDASTPPSITSSIARPIAWPRACQLAASRLPPGLPLISMVAIMSFKALRR